MWSRVVGQFCANLDLWGLFGLVFQVAFMARFLVQWIASERQGQERHSDLVLVPEPVRQRGPADLRHRPRDPVFILGQMFGTVVYVRNLMLIYRGRRGPPATSGGPPGSC